MISFQEAFDTVITTARSFGSETVPLSKAVGRILAEDSLADRDFPPFDRATKDGIAIHLTEDTSRQAYTIQGIAAAGSPQMHLTKPQNGLEIMTGAVIPKNANTVVMYEHLDIVDGKAYIKKPIRLGQNIHQKGSDRRQGSTLLKKHTLLTAAEIGVLATVGQSKVSVQKLPKVILISTGDELVSVDSIPKPHQIRQSNSHTLQAALSNFGIDADIIHIKDDKQTIKNIIAQTMNSSDVLLISGAVSKGKFDYLPEALMELGVQKKFHRVRQRPGKPFWFGIHPVMETTVFGFPGNPVSTFASFYAYFVPWLKRCLSVATKEIHVHLDKPFENKTDLTRLINVHTFLKDGCLIAKQMNDNGSGDLVSLVNANGFIQVEPHAKIAVDEVVTFTPTRNIFW